MSGPPGNDPPAEWYLARDGQQFGPLSDAELRKLVELGHLKPSDLLWREGFPEWRSARILLPDEQPAPPPRAQHAQPPATAPSQHGNPPPYDPRLQPRVPQSYAPQARYPDPAQRGSVGRHDPRALSTFDEEDDFGADADERGSRFAWLKRAAIIAFFLSTLSAAAWIAYPHRAQILGAVTKAVPALVGAAGSTASPIAGFAPTREATDEALQKTLLWRTLKREFPEWYGERIREAAELARNQRPDSAIGQQMMQAVVALRRQHAGDALAATGPRLKAIAAAFADNLARLRSVSVEACFAFISNGETSSSYLDLLNQPAHTAALQGQLTAVFEAVAEGRKLPKVYPPPKQTDYNILVTALEARGWTEADMQLFSDSRALAKAAPEKVCQMVTDWFQGQLAVKDEEAQLRLLADALKPVVAG